MERRNEKLKIVICNFFCHRKDLICKNTVYHFPDFVHMHVFNGFVDIGT